MSAADLRSVLQAHTGLDLTAADVGRAVRERVQQRAGTGREAYFPLPGTDEFDALVDLLVVPESWLLRDPDVFAHALSRVRERLRAQPGAPVRILSLPCAGGEEPYSMAMLLADAGIGPAQCVIDGVDLSRAALARARQGRYTNNAFRSADLAFRARWFTREGDGYLVHPALRAYVRFGQGNLFGPDPLHAGTYDLVFCRNLLIYFDAHACARAASRLAHLLADDGVLLAGYAEVPALCAHGFASDAPHAPFALRKSVKHDVPRPARVRRAALPLSSAPLSSAPLSPAPASSPPDVTRVLLARARIDADGGRHAEARMACDAVLAASPDCAEAHYLLGLLDECAGRADAAHGHWRRCLYLDPHHYEALCGLALLHAARGEADLAASLRRRAARTWARRDQASLRGGLNA